MDVFISWSGPRSRDLAHALRDWLPNVIQSVRPFMSSVDIAAGATWSHEIHDRLEAARFGIICVTGENVTEPWLNYETGALVNSAAKPRVCPLLLQLAPTDITGPLSRLQCKTADEQGVLELIRSINEILDVTIRLQDHVLAGSFKAFWPQINVSFEKIAPATAHAPPRDVPDLVRETLSIVRDIARQKPSRSRRKPTPRQEVVQMLQPRQFIRVDRFEPEARVRVNGITLATVTKYVGHHSETMEDVYAVRLDGRSDDINLTIKHLELVEPSVTED